MQGNTTWLAHPTLSRPLTVLGVERRWFFLSLTLGLAMWNAIGSIMTAGVIFASLYVAGWLAWRRDPAMLSIIAAGAKSPCRFDPGKPASVLVELVDS